MTWNADDNMLEIENGPIRRKMNLLCDMQIEQLFLSLSRHRFSIRASLSGMSRVFINPKGLSWFVTGLFVVGDLAGGGLVALPTAMIQTEFYPGLAISAVMICVVTYTAYLLGLSWNILLNTWPQYREHCRKPYPEIGYRAMGSVFRKVVSICIDITQFGVAVVYLLLSSKNIGDIIKVSGGDRHVDDIMCCCADRHWICSGL
ncbi:hypothetical protein DICVIV_12555 [Dictyocaulus viviparus]|uniref:Amino acid transporter transmembrane domain-containing protein n=1 Tax=Dictyocaulus viviparus TaxID=29172 RepID=A0A0D8XGG7_DICVI|nr:hypothetical protein DICVIV_12555 [Dictyocaulus viviparus]